MATLRILSAVYCFNLTPSFWEAAAGLKRPYAARCFYYTECEGGFKP